MIVVTTETHPDWGLATDITYGISHCNMQTLSLKSAVLYSVQIRVGDDCLVWLQPQPKYDAKIPLTNGERRNWIQTGG